MNEDKATRYHRLRRRAQVVSLVLVGGTLVAFTLGDGGVWLRSMADAAASTLGAGPRWRWRITVMLAAASLGLGLEVLALPVAYYLGLALERRYGLSRQSTAEWWRDHLKASGLALVMGIVPGGLVYAALAWNPRWWWLAAGAGLALLAVLLALVAPVLLFPLFYRLEPLVDSELAKRLTRLADRASVPVLGVYKWSLGDKSRAGNAALIGLGPTRRILLSDTLLQEYPPDEIEVIIAHELAHHAHGDIWKGVATEALQVTLALLAAHVALVSWGADLGVTALDDVAGMPLLAVAAGGWSVLTAPLLLAQSRHHERRADRYALELTTKAEAFVSAMRRLGDQNLADSEPSRLVEWLFHSHPSLGKRIRFARRWAAERLPVPA